MECKRLSQQVGGLVKIDSHIGYFDAADSFFQSMVSLREDNPGVKLQMVQDTEASILDALKAGAVDLALVATVGDGSREWMAERGVSCVQLMQEPTLVWIAKKSVAAQGNAVSIKDLGSLHLRVRCDSRYDMWKQSYDRLFSEVGSRARYSVTCVDSEGEYLLADIDDGDISLGPTSIFKNSRTVKIYGDRVVKPVDPPVMSQAYACYREGDENPALRLLVQWLRREFDE